MRETELGPEEYLTSLRFDGKGPAHLVEVDGAALFKVGTDHFLVLTCVEHPHKGHAYLRRVIPAAWECFYEAQNAEEAFEAYHYGPVMEVEET